MRHTLHFCQNYPDFSWVCIAGDMKKGLPRGDGFPTTPNRQNIFCSFFLQSYRTCLSIIRIADDVQSEHKIVKINGWWERDGLVILGVDAPWKNTIRFLGLVTCWDAGVWLHNHPADCVHIEMQYLSQCSVKSLGLWVINHLKSRAIHTCNVGIHHLKRWLWIKPLW